MAETKYIVINDSSISRYIIKQTIKKIDPGAQMELFESGGEGLEFIEKNRLSDQWTILVRAKLPNMSGLDFIEAGKKIDPNFSLCRTILMYPSNGLAPAEEDELATLQEKHPSVIAYYNQVSVEELSKVLK